MGNESSHFSGVFQLISHMLLYVSPRWLSFSKLLYIASSHGHIDTDYVYMKLVSAVPRDTAAHFIWLRGEVSSSEILLDTRSVPFGSSLLNGVSSLILLFENDPTQSAYHCQLE